MSITDIHTTSENYRQLVAEREYWRAKYLRLRKAIEFVVDELTEDFDINDNGGPNKAMKLANELDEALYGPGGF